MTPVSTRILRIEEALAKALSRGDFEVVTEDGHRFLRPILAGHVCGEIISEPMLDLNQVARDVERDLS